LSERLTCFVIMPFSKTSEEHTDAYWTKHFESFLKPLIEEDHKFEAHRSEPLRGDILRQIITDLVVSQVVVADLTDNNPNVYWELGVRQSFKHGTLTIAESGTKLPFDLGGKGTLFYYPKDHLKNEEFRTRFNEALQDCLSRPEKPDSHVLEAITGRGSLFQLFRRDETIRRLRSLVLECEFNETYLAKTEQYSIGNLKGRPKPIVMPERFAFSCVELLLTDMYLDEKEEFYLLARDCLARLTGMNELLNQFPLSPAVVSRFFVERNETTKEIIQRFKKAVEAALANTSRAR